MSLFEENLVVDRSNIRTIKFRTFKDEETEHNQQDERLSNKSAILFDKVCFQVSSSKQNINASNPIGRILHQVIPNNLNSKPQLIQILKSIQLNVPQGCIFGLLGPSSCGKTTLLRCLVGLLKPHSGSIYLLGEKINHNGNNHGHLIGYMPQDLALYEDFSIRQLLTMFGQYTGMEYKLINERIEFMGKFLELPQVDRVIATLSGGQKRRVSFAIACLHSPPLIILDEPTVGVDPILRKSIWRYLRQLARDQGKTIIITTHYIEEAAQADQVAFMRAGEILVQDEPKAIMKRQNCDTLEEAFLQICSNLNEFKSTNLLVKTSHEDIDINCNNLMKQVEQPSLKEAKRKGLSYHHGIRSKNNGKLKITSSESNSSDTSISKKKQIIQHHGGPFEIDFCKLINNTSHPHILLTDTTNHNKTNKTFKDKLREKGTLIYALFYKNYRRNMNSIPLIAFQFMLPIIQMISFSLCVGGRPSQVGLGLVNHDSLNQFSTKTSLDNITTLGFNNTELFDTGNEDYNFPTRLDDLLSRRYLKFVDPNVLNIREYPNLELALRDVREAKLWAAIEFNENFTTTLMKRFDPENFYTLDSKDWISQSIIKLYPDKSNKILDMICMRILVNSFREFLASQFDHLKQLPIQVKQVIFDIKPNLISNSLDGYTESIAAGLLASLTYIMAAGLTTFIMVVERGRGILERTYTSGVNPIIYLLAHAIFRSFVMMIQIALVMFLTFYLLKQPLVGSLSLAYLMLMTLNFTGISYGLLISSLVEDQNGAALTIVSSLVLKITMSGILWPLEAIPVWLRTICLIQPLTLPIQALKQITLKGATIEHKSVQLGFAVSICWTCFFLFMAARKFRFYQH